MDEELTTTSKKPLIIIGGVIIFLLIGIGLYFYFSRTEEGGSGIKSFGSLFGNNGEDIPRPSPTPITPTGGTVNQNPGSGGSLEEEPLFRQLANFPIAGATTVTRDGKTFVRYIARENGFVYDVDPMTGVSVQLTNTTIPRIYEAYFGNAGGTLVLRYLIRDQLSRQDVIKTRIADLSLPEILPTASTTQDVLGSLSGSASDFLQDNVTTVSISPDGTKLFYLLPVQDGVSGSMVELTTRSTKEILRSTFSEWLPQVVNDGTVILTTKASARVPGFSYLYNPQNKTYSRLVREKNGLTTLAEPSGKRLVYSENIGVNTILSLFDVKGFGDHGEIEHTQPLQLATLPEKCVWASNRTRLFCGAFAATPRTEIPDNWYQGILSFNDTFWTIDTSTSEITFLADPSKEKSAGINFDVFMPFTGGDENHLFFVNKKDATLWSMHIIKDKFTASEENTTGGSPNDIPLTEDELKDAVGSTNANAPR